MGDVVSLFTSCLFLAFSVHRLAITRGAAADPAQRYIAGFGLCLGTAMLVNAPVVTRLPVGSGTMGAIELLLTDELKTVSLTFLALVALALTAPATSSAASRRRHTWSGVVVVVTSTLLFLSAHVTADTGDVSVPRGHRWALATHNALLALYGAWCLALLVRALLRHLRWLEPGPLRTGFRLMALAAAVGMVWSLGALDDVIGDLETGRQTTDEDPLSAVLGSITALLATTGATTSLWSGRLGAPVRWLRAYRRYRALQPLWTALYAELPQIALDPSAAERRPALREAEFALYRRVIEIRDGLLALRPYIGGATSTAPPARADLERGPVREAASIAAALDNLRAGRRQDGDRAGTGDLAGAQDRPSGVPGTVEAETSWLLEVTAALASAHALPGGRSTTLVPLTARGR